MAAARLNIPSIVVPCGYQLGGHCGGKEVDIEEVYRAVGTVSTGLMTIEELEDWTRVAIQGPGVCAGLATANSMHILAESLGMTLSGTTPIRAGSRRLFDVAGAAGRQVMSLVRDNLLPRQILTVEAFENAVRVALAIGASVNTVRHLAAIATEAELDVDIIKMLEELGRETPQITNIKPNGNHRIEELDAAGGTRGILYRLKEMLNLDVLTIGGTNLRAVLDQEIKINAEVIRPCANPFHREPGLIVLRGNLAPDGAIVKLSAVPGAVKEFRRSRRASSRMRIWRWIELAKGAVHPGDVVVLRMMGPVGGPGTVFACSFMAALSGAGLADHVAVVTDGELSGLNRGITIGQVMPEAACGGPLAIVQEGERILIDLGAKTIRLDVSEDEIERRLQNWKMPARTVRPGWLAQYAELVQPLSKGAVLGVRNPRQS